MIKNFSCLILLSLAILCFSSCIKEEPSKILLKRSSQFKHYDSTKIKVANYIETYLNTIYESKDLQYVNDNWDSDILMYRQDRFLIEGNKHELLIKYPPKILGIRENKDGAFYVKLAMYDKTDLRRVLELKILRDPLNRFYFKDVFGENLKEMALYTNKENTFYYHPSIPRDTLLEDSTQYFNQKIADFFEIPTRPITVVVLRDFKSYHALIGYDYSIELNSDIQQGGRAFPAENILISMNATPYYPHEMVHIYANVNYKKAHNWFNEGIAAYFGGSVGYSLDYHLRKLANNLEEQDFSNIPENRNYGKTTSYIYAIGGLLVKKAMDKGGKEAVFKLLSYSNTDDSFYLAIEEVLGVNKESLEEYIVEEISQYKTK